MREKFQQAHKMTREMKAKYPEINYKTQFGICLSYILKNNVETKEEIIDINTDIKTQKEFVQIIADMYEKKLLESDKDEYSNFYSANRYTKVNFWREKRFYINSTVFEKRGSNHKVRERKQELGYVELKDGKLNFYNLEPAKLWIDYVYPKEILELAKTEFNKKNKEEKEKENAISYTITMQPSGKKIELIKEDLEEKVYGYVEAKVKNFLDQTNKKEIKKLKELIKEMDIIGKATDYVKLEIYNKAESYNITMHIELMDIFSQFKFWKNMQYNLKEIIIEKIKKDYFGEYKKATIETQKEVEEYINKIEITEEKLYELDKFIRVNLKEIGKKYTTEEIINLDITFKDNYFAHTILEQLKRFNIREIKNKIQKEIEQKNSAVNTIN